MTKDQKKVVMTVVVPIQVFLAVLAWRDMSRRTDAQIRGTRRMWRVFVLLNPGNSVLYWLFGRRSASGLTPVEASSG